MEAVGKYFNILDDYLRAKLFYSALELNIFSFLDEGMSIDKLSEITKYDRQNLFWFMTTLASEEFVLKKDELFVNTDMAKKYLSDKSEFFIGDSLLHKKNMMEFTNLSEKVKNGSSIDEDNKEAFKDVYDFKSVAESSANEIKLFRRSSLIDNVSTVFNKDQRFRFLDLGGGSGMLAIELAKFFPNSTGVIFEEQSVAEVAEKFVKQESLIDRIEVKSGNFLVDDIGSDYDLIIASGVFHFAKSYLYEFVQKIYNALKNTGYLYSATKVVSEDYVKPRGILLKWLSSFIDGQNYLLNGDEFYNILSKYKFIEVDNSKKQAIRVLYKKDS